MLTTLLQAKKLKELGYDKPTYRRYYFSLVEEWRLSSTTELDNHNESDMLYSAPSVSEALEWFREVKGVNCSVNLYQDDTIEDCICYVGCYKDCDVIRPIQMKLTHAEAESALLDAIIKYLEQ